MVYNVFKNNHNLTAKQQQEALQDIVENAAYNIIYEHGLGHVFSFFDKD